MKNENKLKGRDLINIGVFGAIYFVILFAVAMLGMIPIFLPLLSVLIPIVGGIPFMLFLTKVKNRNDLYHGYDYGYTDAAYRYGAMASAYLCYRRWTCRD